MHADDFEKQEQRDNRQTGRIVFFWLLAVGAIEVPLCLCGADHAAAWVFRWLVIVPVGICAGLWFCTFVYFIASRLLP